MKPCRTKQVLNIVGAGISWRGRSRDFWIASLLPFQIKVDRDENQANGQQAKSAGENDDRGLIDWVFTFSNIQLIVFQICWIHGEMIFWWETGSFQSEPLSVIESSCGFPESSYSQVFFIDQLQLFNLNFELFSTIWWWKWRSSRSPILFLQTTPNLVNSEFI